MNKWIKCSRKMPDKDGRYLVAEYYASWTWVGVSSLRNGKWDGYITKYWMELPLPPNENKG